MQYQQSRRCCVFIALLFLIQNTIGNGQTINCNPVCDCNTYGECYQDTLNCIGSTYCTVRCTHRDACQDAVINCKDGIPCNVECGEYGYDDEWSTYKDSGCYSAQINGHSASSLTITTEAEYESGYPQKSLESATINCPNGGSCSVSCTGTYANCYQSTINAKDASSLNIDCTGTQTTQTCGYMTVYCPDTASSVCSLQYSGTSNSYWEFYELDIYSLHGFNQVAISGTSAVASTYATVHCQVGYVSSCSILGTSNSCNSPTDICTSPPTKSPTLSPSAQTTAPTSQPTVAPSHTPTAPPSQVPTSPPSLAPTNVPTSTPSLAPTDAPSIAPSNSPSNVPSSAPTQPPTAAPSNAPTTSPPSVAPSQSPITNPTKNPSTNPSKFPSKFPTKFPTKNPTKFPTKNPTKFPTKNPTKNPTKFPSTNPSTNPSKNPSTNPTFNPSKFPSTNPSKNPTSNPSKKPTASPTSQPTESPTTVPTDASTDNPNISGAATSGTSSDLNNLESTFRTVAIILLSVLAVITLAAWSDSKWLRTNDYLKISHISGISLQALDMISDCFFAGNVSMQYRINSKYLVLLILSISFIIIPTSMTIIQLYLHSEAYWLHSSDQVRGWLAKKTKMLYILSTLTGSSFAAISLVNSYIFQLDVFDMGLTQKEMSAFAYKRVYSVVLLENLPQLCLQILYVVYVGSFDPITISSMIFSLLSIIVSVLSMLMEKSLSQSQGFVAISMKITGPAITSKAKNCKTRKNILMEQLALFVGVHSSAVEVVKPTQIKKGFEVDVHFYFGDVNKEQIDFYKVLVEAQQSEELQLIFKDSWDLSAKPIISDIKHIVVQSQMKRLYSESIDERRKRETEDAVANVNTVEIQMTKKHD